MNRCSFLFVIPSEAEGSAVSSGCQTPNYGRWWGDGTSFFAQNRRRGTEKEYARTGKETPSCGIKARRRLTHENKLDRAASRYQGKGTEVHRPEGWPTDRGVCGGQSTSHPL